MENYVPDEYLYENGYFDIDGMNYLSQVDLTAEKPKKSALPMVLTLGLLLAIAIKAKKESVSESNQ